MVIVFCTGCNNANTNKELILQERKNSQPLILATSRMFVKDYRPGLLVFSPDSQFILARDLDMGNHVYSLNHDEPALIFNAEKYPELADVEFEVASFIDNNLIYISGYRLKQNDSNVFIYQLSPPELISHSTYRPTARSPIRVNKDFIAVNQNLTNWHTKQSWEIKTAHPAIAGYLLNSSGQVITFDWYSNWILLSDPINDNYSFWDSGIDIYLMVLSTSEDYLIALSSKGDCVVWQLSDQSKIGHCGGGNWFSEAGKMRVVTNPKNDQFALIRDNKITVYSLPSLEKLFELTFEGQIDSADFSGDLLVVADNTGRAELWQVSSQKLLGISPEIHPYLPTIQPNGGHIAWIKNDQLKFFKIPK